MVKDFLGNPSIPSVIVIGGGLAGLAAACDLCDKGFSVTLLEKRGFIGGRAYSFKDPTTGYEVDNGQHVFMKCCTYYIDFLKKLGVYDKTYTQNRMKVQMIDGVNGLSALTSVPLPAPLHLVPSFFKFRHLSLQDKTMVLYAVLQILSLDKTERLALDDRTFYSWLKEQRQTERAIQNFWNIVNIHIPYRGLRGIIPKGRLSSPFGQNTTLILPRGIIPLEPLDVILKNI